MKERVKAHLINMLSRQKVQILVGPRGAGQMNFLSSCLSSALKERFPNYATQELRDSESKDCLHTFIRAAQSKKLTIFFLENIYLSKNYEAIVDVVSSDPSLRLIATSNSFFPYDCEDHLEDPNWWPTASRGRVLKVFFPATIWDDYHAEYPDAKPLDFLFDKDLDHSILSAPKWALRSEKAKRVSEIMLSRSGTALTNREVQRIYEAKHGESISITTVSLGTSDFDNFCLFYFLKRYDLKKRRILSRGTYVYPVTNAMFGEERVSDESIYRRGESALVAEFFYEGFNVLRACHPQQSSSRGKRAYEIVDDGFLLEKDNARMIVRFAVRIDGDLVASVEAVPSGHRKVIVSAEMLAPTSVLENGIVAVSLEHALQGGLIHDGIF